MCNKPIFVQNPCPGRLQKLAPVERGNYFLPSLSGFYVPCGKCMECLHKKHMSRVPQYVREMEQHEHTAFVTLTYDNHHIPLSLYMQDTCESVDYETGEITEVIESSKCKVLDSSERAFIIDLLHIDMTGTLKSVSHDFGNGYSWRVTPSLHRDDVRLYIKRKRLEFQRKGRPFKFKYVVVGEYGPRSSRPHYHLLCCGLSASDARYFFHDWKHEFGNICVREVKDKLDGGHLNNSKVAVSYYVSKYMSKGCFECDCAKYGWSEKPRTMISLDFGCELTDKEFEYYSPSSWSPDDIERISMRTYYIIGDIKYPLPSSWKRRFRYELNITTTYDWQNEKIVNKYVYRPTPLQVACSDFVRIRLNELYMRKLRESEDIESPNLPYSVFAESVVDENACKISKEKDGFTKLREFYAKSVF